MSKGDIILVNFPFTIPAQSKVRPALVLTETIDRFHDILVCAISSVVPFSPSEREIVLKESDPDFEQTGLRVSSVIKVDRIATLRQSDSITVIGKCSPRQWRLVVDAFRSLIS